MARFTSKHMTVYLLDLAGLSMELGPGPGDLSISNLMEGNREAITVRDRGANDGSVYGDEVEQEMSLTLAFRNQSLVSSTAERVLNALLKKGTFASAQTADAGGQVYRLRVRVRFQDEAGNIDWIELPSVRFTGEISVATEGSTLSLSGTNNKTPLIGTSEVFA